MVDYKLYNSKTTLVQRQLILLGCLIIYIIAFFYFYHIWENGMGIVVFIGYLTVACTFYGKQGGIIASIFGIIINLLLGLIVSDKEVIFNSFIQGIIFYPLVGLGTGHLKDTNVKLKLAQSEIKQLRGMLPICANCKNIRDDEGYWNSVEDYISENSEVKFSHSLCPDCSKKLYPDLNL